ncbi:hypothetical protein GQ457_08G027180 [Hibiscus cannabinus]
MENPSLLRNPSEVVIVDMVDALERPSSELSAGDQSVMNRQVGVPSFKEKLLGSAWENVLGPGLGVLDVQVREEDVRVGGDRSLLEIQFLDKLHDAINAKLSTSIIIRLLGKSIGYRALLNRLRAMWNPRGDMFVVDLDNDYYLARFAVEEDYLRVLAEGLWVIYGSYLTVQRWSRYFSTNEAHSSPITAWVRLPKLPYRYFMKSLFRHNVAAIGSVVISGHSKDICGLDSVKKIVEETKAPHKGQLVGKDSSGSRFKLQEEDVDEARNLLPVARVRQVWFLKESSKVSTPSTLRRESVREEGSVGAKGGGQMKQGRVMALGIVVLVATSLVARNHTMVQISNPNEDNVSKVIKGHLLPSSICSPIAKVASKKGVADPGLEECLSSLVSNLDKVAAKDRGHLTAAQARSTAEDGQVQWRVNSACARPEVSDMQLYEGFYRTWLRYLNHESEVAMQIHHCPRNKFAPMSVIATACKCFPEMNTATPVIVHPKPEVERQQKQLR